MAKKSILITGASSGIGRYAAEGLAKKGYSVFATARQAKDIEALRELGLQAIQLDVTDNESIEKALQQVLTVTGGTLDALFNNAGIMQTGALQDLTLDQIRHQLETNFFGVVMLTQSVLPIMRKQRHGRIIQNSSVLGFITMPFYGAYSASKFALEGYSQTLRQELFDTNIHVSIINPGPVKTALKKNAHKLYQQVTQHDYYQKDYERFERQYFKNQATDIAQSPAVVFKQLMRALESRSPKIHYYPGWPAKTMAFVHRFLPEKLVNNMLVKLMRNT